MKTIEERTAEIFADRFCTRCPKILYTTCDRKLPGCCRIPEVRCMHEVIKNTIAFEREELTRWHDPKEELPDGNRDVLIKTTLCTKYRIAFYKANETRNYHWHENNGAIDDDMVIGWREIHE